MKKRHAIAAVVLTSLATMLGTYAVTRTVELGVEAKPANATTVKAMRAADKGKGKRLTSAGALFKDLGV